MSRRSRPGQVPPRGPGRSGIRDTDGILASLVHPEKRHSKRNGTPEADPISPGLYVVATPIGNLGDITVRALETLAAASVIACEDTRVTATLTQRFSLKTPLLPYHEHNADKQRPKILEALAEGRAVALEKRGNIQVDKDAQKLLFKSK